MSVDVADVPGDEQEKPEWLGVEAYEERAGVIQTERVHEPVIDEQRNDGKRGGRRS